MGPVVDTSVLIDYFAGVKNRETSAFDDLLDEGVAPATVPVIVQEFLQGFTSASDLARARGYLAPFDRLEAPTYQIHELAAELHFDGRRSGEAVPTVDTLIVTMARESGRALLTRDRHQKVLAKIAGVALA